MEESEDPPTNSSLFRVLEARADVMPAFLEFCTKDWKRERDREREREREERERQREERERQKRERTLVSVTVCTQQ